MKIELKPYRILEYFDVPEIFLAKDKIDAKYLCLRISGEAEIEFVAIPVSNSRINDLLRGNIDLKNAIVNKETEYWFLVHFSEEEKLVSSKYEERIISEEYLPASDYFFNLKKEDNQQIIKEANEKNNAIIHLSVSSSINKEGIEVEPLANILRIFQNLIKNTYKKIYKANKNEQRINNLDPSDFTLLTAFASSNGSFNIHLFPKREYTMLGHANVEPVLRKIDELLKYYQNDDEIIEQYRAVQGHPISNIKQLIDNIIERNVIFDYYWASPDNKKISNRSISIEYAKKINKIIMSKSDLGKEIKEFTGYISKADDKTGSWRIKNIDDQTEYSGDAEPEILKGITLSDKLYKFTCEEEIEEMTISNKEKIKYRLITKEVVMQDLHKQDILFS